MLILIMTIASMVFLGIMLLPLLFVWFTFAIVHSHYFISYNTSSRTLSSHRRNYKIQDLRQIWVHDYHDGHLKPWSTCTICFNDGTKINCASIIRGAFDNAIRFIREHDSLLASEIISILERGGNYSIGPLLLFYDNIRHVNSNYDISHFTWRIIHDDLIIKTKDRYVCVILNKTCYSTLLVELMSRLYTQSVPSDNVAAAFRPGNSEHNDGSQG